jgi:hypothetical protein
MGGNKQHKKQGKSANKPKHTSGAAAAARSTDAKKPVTINDISTEFQTIILDFLRDIDCSFPEYHETLAKYLGYSHEMKPMPDELYIELYTHCKEVYPVRFFDILYKNEASLFAAAAETDDDAKAVFFLPGIDFREIWATEDIADNTKDIIWKYLQLVLFSIVNNLSDMGSFGDTAKLFEAIDDNELKTKLEEVIGEMGSMFGGADGADGADDGSTPQSHPNLDETLKKATEFMSQAFEGHQTNGAGSPGGGGGSGPAPSSAPPVPDASAIHEHLSGILNGKIGKLAKEIAEETAADLNLDMENETSMKGVFQQLLKNPGKLSGIIKTVGSKLDSKLKSGELKESEIMQEASELMSKMKNMPGMNNLASMLSKMGMNMPGGLGGGGGGGGGKVNFGAMQSQLNKNMKQAQMRERLLKKVHEKQAAAAAAQAAAAASPVSGATTAVFTSGEKPAKTPRVPGQAQGASAAQAPTASALPEKQKQKND